MNGLRTTAHASSDDALPPTKRWRCRPIKRRHPRGRLDRLNRQQPQRYWRHKSPPTTYGGARCHRRPQWHLPLTTSCPLRAWGGDVPKHSRTIARWGQWHPRPARILLGRQRHFLPLMGGEVLERCRQPLPPSHTLPWGGGLRVDGTLTRCSSTGDNAITDMGTSFA